MPTQATLPEVPDTILDVIDDLPEVAKAQQEYNAALRSLCDAVRGNPVLNRLVLDLDGLVGNRSYISIAGGYALGLQAAL